MESTVVVNNSQDRGTQEQSCTCIQKCSKYTYLQYRRAVYSIKQNICSSKPLVNSSQPLTNGNIIYWLALFPLFKSIHCSVEWTVINRNCLAKKKTSATLGPTLWADTSFLLMKSFPLQGFVSGWGMLLGVLPINFLRQNCCKASIKGICLYRNCWLNL